MATWEYKMERLVSTQGTEMTKSLKSLNELGAKGWEVVAWILSRANIEEGLVLLKKHHG